MEHDPAAALFREESKRLLYESVGRLAADPRTFVLRHHVGEEPIGMIAADAGRTPHALEQALVRARQRLRAILERQGLTGESLLFHLSGPE